MVRWGDLPDQCREYVASVLEDQFDDDDVMFPWVVHFMHCRRRPVTIRAFRILCVIFGTRAIENFARRTEHLRRQAEWKDKNRAMVDADLAKRKEKPDAEGTPPETEAPSQEA